MDVKNLMRSRLSRPKTARKFASCSRIGIRQFEIKVWPKARVQPGQRTAPHYHPKTEEIYYILHGSGEMTIDKEIRRVGPGDAIAIPPGAVHTILNSGKESLVFLCCCAPGYENDDTVLVDQ